MSDQTEPKWVVMDRMLSAVFEKAIIAFAALLVVIAFASAGSVILEVLVNR